MTSQPKHKSIPTNQRFLERTRSLGAEEIYVPEVMWESNFGSVLASELAKIKEAAPRQFVLELPTGYTDSGANEGVYRLFVAAFDFEKSN